MAPDLYSFKSQWDSLWYRSTAPTSNKSEQRSSTKTPATF